VSQRDRLISICRIVIGILYDNVVSGRHSGVYSLYHMAMWQDPCISFHRAALLLIQHWSLSAHHSLHLRHPHLIISGAILTCTVSQPPLQPLPPVTSSVIDDHRALSHLVSKTPFLHHASLATLVSYPPIVYSVLYSCHVLQASSLYFLSSVVSRSLSVLVSDSSFGRCIVRRI
jgi:hypothetical protein